MGRFAEAYNDPERVGESVISVCKKEPKGLTNEFYGCEKVGKRSCCVIYSYFRDSAFAGVERDKKL